MHVFGHRFAGNRPVWSRRFSIFFGWSNASLWSEKKPDDVNLTMIFIFTGRQCDFSEYALRLQLLLCLMRRGFSNKTTTNMTAYLYIVHIIRLNPNALLVEKQPPTETSRNYFLKKGFWKSCNRLALLIGAHLYCVAIASCMQYVFWPLVILHTLIYKPFHPHRQRRERSPITKKASQYMLFNNQPIALTR